jgi:hypothetical protein
MKGTYVRSSSDEEQDNAIEMLRGKKLLILSLLLQPQMAKLVAVKSNFFSLCRLRNCKLS